MNKHYKKVALFLVIQATTLFTTLKSQTQFWGTTSLGGPTNAGTIYSTDNNGNNQVIQHHFMQVDGANPYYSKLVKASNGKLYGVTSTGGPNNYGVVVEFDPVTNECSNVIMPNGFTSHSSFIEASNGKLYTMEAGGGANNYGYIMRYDPAIKSFIMAFNFNLTNGAGALGSFVQASDGKFYGLTGQGGSHYLGVLFQYNPLTNAYVKKYDFDSIHGSVPDDNLMQASDGKLYGLTYAGGNYNKGTLFQFDIATNTLVKKFDFDGATNGNYPRGSLVQGNDGMLYGMTRVGGANDMGVLFQFDPLTDTFTKKVDLSSSQGSYPFGTLLNAQDGKLYGLTSEGGVSASGVIFQYNINTSTYTKIFDFNGSTSTNSTGYWPYGSLMQMPNGMMYGMTCSGGVFGAGTLFQFDPSTNTFTKRLDFGGAAGGKYPSIPLVQASNGKLYGIATSAGNGYTGILYEYDFLSNTYSPKINLISTMGQTPSGAMIQATDGKLYGSTSNGGSGGGLIFQYNFVANTYAVKYNFNYANGQNPIGPIIQASDGKLYGTTRYGGALGSGVLYQFNIVTNTIIKKHDFTSATGLVPHGLMEANDGMLYGLTSSGGSLGKGVIYQYDPLLNNYTLKYSFDSINGKNPGGTLVQADDGMLYGTTSAGGDNNLGVLFQYDPLTATVTKKVDFTQINGATPATKLLKASNGKLYGTTNVGGTANDGVMFEYDPATTTYTKKIDFSGVNGVSPMTNLIEIASSTEVQKIVSENIFTVYPNPFTSQTTLCFTKEEKNITIKLTDMLGKEVKSINFSGKEYLLDKGEIKPGIYFVQLFDKTKNIENKKIIIQ